MKIALVMNIKKLFLVGAAIFAAGFALQAQVSDVKIWQGVKMPGKVAEGSGNKSSGQYAKPNEGFQAVREPFFRFYKANTQSNKPAPAVVICPGGGYGHLAFGKEGTEIAEFLAEGGTSCFVLGYRIPGNNRDGALQDAQRALRLIRRDAKKYNIDPNRLGIMGFSAGAHLSARTSTNYETSAYEPVDAADKLSARPDFTVLIYPAYLADKKTLALAPEIKVDKNTPKAFVAQTQKDSHYEASSVGYTLALRSAGVPVDFHYFSDGDHGYGLREKTKPVSAWGELLKAWLKANKLAD